MFLIVFTFLMHIFFTKEGALLLDWKFIKIYEEGLRQGIFISIRFLVLGSDDVDFDIDDFSDFNHGWYGRFIEARSNVSNYLFMNCTDDVDFTSFHSDIDG